MSAENKIIAEDFDLEFDDAVYGDILDYLWLTATEDERDAIRSKSKEIDTSVE